MCMPCCLSSESMTAKRSLEVGDVEVGGETSSDTSGNMYSLHWSLKIDVVVP